MRPLKLNQKFLTLVSLRASPDDITRPEKLLNTAVGLYVFVTFCLDLISSSFFVIQYKKRELEDVLGSVLQIAAVLSNIIAMSHVFMHSKQLQGIFSQFQAIYNECAQDESFRIFTRVNQLSIRVTKLLVINYVFGYCILSVALAIVNVTFCYIKDDKIAIECLYTPYKHILPWDDEQFIGWLYGLFCSFWMSATYFFMNNILLSFFLSICFNFDAFQQQFEAILSAINETKSNQSNFDQNAKQILQRAIRFHNSVKVLFVDVDKVYGGVLFAQLLCGATFIAASLFQMDMAIHHLDIYFYAYVNAVLISVANLYLYCYAGATVTINCSKYSNTIFQQDWYLMSADLQKYLILMIRSTYRPLVFSGYGILKLNLETFTSVLKTVMSYYLMFKTLTE